MKDKGNDAKRKLRAKDLQYKGAERERLENSHKKRSITSAVMDDYKGLNLSPTATRALAFLT